MPHDLASVEELALTTYTPHPLLRIDRPVAGGGFRVSTGSGSGRETIEVTGASVVRWLVGRVRPADRVDLVRSLASDVSLQTQEAESLVDLLLEKSFLVPTTVADSLRTTGATWEINGWRDAFDYHFAVHGQEWDRTRRKEYEDALRGLYDDVASVGPQPPSVKSVTGRRIALDAHVREPESTLRESLLGAVPINVFTDFGITLEQLATVVSLAHGVRHTRNLVLGEHLFKASPSGGARYPVEVYVAAREVDGLEPGVYHYAPKENELVALRGPEALPLFDGTCFDKGGIRTSSAILFFSYRFTRHAWKYRYSRTFRMVLMELGHNFQTTRIAASAVGLDVYYNPAIHDQLVSDILMLGEDCEEGPMLSIGLGRGGVA